MGSSLKRSRKARVEGESQRLLPKHFPLPLHREHQRPKSLESTETVCRGHEDCGHTPPGLYRNCFAVRPPYYLPPSIRCAEIAAATKTFLEMHYANLESHYENLAQDHTHLRRLRALKTKGTALTTQCPYMRTNMRLRRPLGKGSFGLVELVQEVSSGRVYALKIMRKSAMLNNGQEAHLKCERDLLVAFAKKESVWIVPLIQSFQDADNLYLMMSFMEGGDFLGLLLRDEVLTEEATRFYVAEMICAVEEVHSMGWIHRDLKPDNFLIDGNGHLKLTDFGLAFSPHWSHQLAYFANNRVQICDRLGFEIHGDESDSAYETSSSANQYAYPAGTVSQPAVKHQGASMSAILIYRGLERATHHDMINNHYNPTITDELDSNACATWRRNHARSCVGTSQYMAPEVIQGQRYDRACDWWSIGCILYECLFGSTPFYDTSRDRVKAKAIRWAECYKTPRKPRIQRPHTDTPVVLPDVSREVRHLLRGIICDKEQRLSCAMIKSHPWFAMDKTFAWNKLIYAKAPWVPERRRPEDIACYFGPEEQIGPMEDKYKRPRDKVLRDPVCGPEALDVRKQTAFLGYTFRKSDLVGWGSGVAGRVVPVDSTWRPEWRLGDMTEEEKRELGELEAVQWMETVNHVARGPDGPLSPVTLSAF